MLGHFLLPVIPVLLVLAAAFGAFWVFTLMPKFGVAIAAPGLNHTYGPVNQAASLRAGGFMGGFLIALSGVVMGGDTESFGQNMLLIALYSVVALGFMTVALYINERFILPDIDNHAAIQQGNMAVAIVEMGGLLATGLILRQAINIKTGIDGIFASAVCFALAQGALFLLTAWFRSNRFHKSSIVQEIETHGNMAAAILVFGVEVGYGFILATAAGIPFVFATMHWFLISFAAIAAFGVVTLLVLDWGVDKFVITWATVEEIVERRCVGSATLMALATIGGSWVLATIATALSFV